MIQKNHIKSSLYFILIIWLTACKNETNTTNNTAVPENLIDYDISLTDSGIQLKFSNITLKDRDSFKIRINGHASSYKIISDKLALIDTDSTPAGKIIFDFIYHQGVKKDTISKSFFLSLNVEYEIVKILRHNRTYFTQGLLFDETGNLIESSGLMGVSRILFYRKSGEAYLCADSIVNTPYEFGEGIVTVNGQLIQLLWKNMYIRIFDKKNHKHIRNIEYSKEGWGICNDKNKIYTSDGSGNIHVIDISGSSARVIRSFHVMDEEGIISNINELEFIDGMIFANIWQSNFIYIIDPNTGYVLGKMDLDFIVKKEAGMNPGIDVLNGIAYNTSNQTLLITGKYWANFYELKLKTYPQLDAR